MPPQAATPPQGVDSGRNAGCAVGLVAMQQAKLEKKRLNKNNKRKCPGPLRA